MLVDLSGDPASPLYVLRLWAHCQQRRTARFTGLAPSSLKAICRAGALEANKLRSILLQCGFIRADGDLTIVHDWEATNASLIRSWENGKKGGRSPKNPQETRGLPSGNPHGTDKSRQDKKSSEANASSETVADEPSASRPENACQADEEFLHGLRADPKYTGIDIDLEAGKMRRWCQTHLQKPSRKRFVNWLNKALHDRPLQANGNHRANPNELHRVSKRSREFAEPILSVPRISLDD